MANRNNTSTVSYTLTGFEDSAKGLANAILLAAESAEKAVPGAKLTSLSFRTAQTASYEGPIPCSASVTFESAVA